LSLVLVDSNVLLDILTEDRLWCDWSAKALSSAAESAVLCINPIIYAEISIGFSRIEELDEAIPTSTFRRLELPWSAAFLAGKCYVQYQKRGGNKRSPLPDFFIGAHAAIAGMVLLTRDAARYRTYFPGLTLITP